MASVGPQPIHLEITISDLETEPITAEQVRANVESYAANAVKCRKHKKPLARVDVEIAPGRASVDCIPCCVRSAKELKVALRSVKSMVDDRAVPIAPEGHTMHRVDGDVVRDPRAFSTPALLGVHGARFI